MNLIENNHLKTLHRVVDIGILTASFISAYMIKKYFLPEQFRGISQVPNYYFVLLLVLISCFTMFNLTGFYRSYRGKTIDQIIGNTLKGTFLGFGGVILLLYMIKEADISRLMMFIFIVLGFSSLLINKLVIYYSLQIYKSREFNFKNILIIGSRKRAYDLIRRVVKTEDSGIRIVGCLEVDESRVGLDVFDGVRVTGTMQDFNRFLCDNPVDEVVFAMPLKQIPDIKEHIFYAENIGVNIRVLPDWEIPSIMYKPENASAYFNKFMGVQTIVLSSLPQNSGALFTKSIMDYLIAFVLTVLLIPLFIVIALLIKLTSSGPVLYSQKRSGLGGREFNLLKFRTMVQDAEIMQAQLTSQNEVDGPVFKIKNDPRITWLGKILRKSSLDELPQLVNILRGEMSLVGPRPPIPDEVKKYEVWQRRRLSMKPGLTCIWQVSGRNNIDFEAWMKMDLKYIDNWSLWLDLKLLFLTMPAVIFSTGH
jgi:exopolysaccharide biosynthesis polyprenyl glycosylphosphotransferase